MVGLTGGIGAGKSAVAERLVRRGAVLIDADRLAREVVAAGTEGLAEVVAAFGADILGPDGELDRPALGARVFGDEPARRRLEGIIHPRVRARSAAMAAAAASDAIVVNDVPLLVETGLGPSFQLVVVVESAGETRLRRLTERRGMSPAEARARIAAQAGDDDRLDAADALVPNEAGLPELDTAVDRLWTGRLVPFEANLRGGRCADLVGVARAGVSDPTWPAQAARLAARIRQAWRPGPDADVVVTHVGPTAVPGLPAADVIDLLVGVRTPEQLDAATSALARAGLPRLPAGRDDEGDRSGGAGTPGPEVWHGSADPGRPTSVRLTLVDSPGWRSTLLLRDHLRAVPAARDAYLALRRAGSAGAAGGDVDGWARCRQQPVDVTAEHWAAQTGWTPPRT